MCFLMDSLANGSCDEFEINSQKSNSLDEPQNGIDLTLRMNESCQVLMFDKNAKRRCAALREVRDTLRNHYIVDNLDYASALSLLDTLQTLIAHQRNKGERGDCLDCATMLCAQFGPEITESPHFDPLLESIHGFLTKDISEVKTMSPKIPLAYAMLNFVSGEFGQASLAVFEEIMSRRGKNSVELVERSIFGWSLLFSALAEFQLVAVARRMVHACLGNLLDCERFSGDTNWVTVRQRAAEMICLVVERVTQLESANKFMKELETKLEPLMGDLSVIPAKNVAKRDRSLHRGSLRSLESLFTPSKMNCPRVKLKINRNCVVIDTWTLYVRYCAFRDIFSGRHLERNRFCHLVLGIEDSPEDSGCVGGGRVISRKEAQKRRSRERRRDIYYASHYE